MKRRLLAMSILASLVTVTGLLAAGPASVAAKDKVWTVTERQVELRKKVEKGLQDNELTAKEAKRLNNHLDDIASDVEQMKTHNAGKLSYKDEGKIEKRLNGVSVDLDKYELAKRVVAH